MDPMLGIGIGIGIGCRVVDHHLIYETASYALAPARSIRVARP